MLALAGILAGGQSAQAQASPVINVLYPNGTNLFQASPTLTFTASSSVGISPSAITVQLTGTTLPGAVYTATLTSANGLTVTGPALSPSVSAPLASNTVYTAVIQVTDANESTASATVSFDTISPAYTFEAEDFDYDSGRYINNPQTNAYYGQPATTAVDAYNQNFSGGANSYNRANGLNTEPNGDKPRAAYDGTGKTDYDAGWATGGNWANYTRNFPAGTYNVYVRISNPNGATAEAASLSLVSNGRGTSSQTTKTLGTFSAPATGGWQVYSWAPVLDTNGDLVQFSGGSEETLRVTTDNGSYNANFYLLMPANVTVPVITNLYPGGSAFFQYTNQLSFVAESSAGIAMNNVVVTLDGVNVASLLNFSGSPTNWLVTCPLALNTNHNAAITVTADNNEKATATLSFNDFAATNYQFEAEDYDYNGGEYFDNPQTDAYVGRASIAGVDNVQADLNANPLLYRPAPAPSTTVAGDGQRPQFSSGGIDYNIGFFGSRSWVNYTRHYPAGTYYVEGRFAEGTTNTEAVFSQLASGHGTSAQTSNVLGTFFIPPTGGWSNWRWTTLTDTNDHPVKLRFDGSQTTLQLAGSPVSSQPEVNVNFFMLVPAVPDPFVVVQVINYETTNLEVIYSKPVAPATATNIANYVFTNGLAVTGAVLNPDTLTVVLTTAPLVYGSNYSMVINGVQDRMNLPNTIATNTAVNFQALPYIMQSLGNPAVIPAATVVSNGLSVTSVGSDAGGTNDQGNFSYQPYAGNFDVCVRVADLGLSDIFAKAGLMAREQLTASGRFAASIATPAMNGTFFEWRDPAGSPANTAGSFPANYPNTWLRLQRVGNTFTGYAGYDGQTWTELGSDSISMSNRLEVGFWVSSHSTNTVTTAQFLDFSGVTNRIVGTQINPHDAIGPSSRKSPVAFSEIMWKPAPRTDGKNLEYLELYNSNPWFQDLTGYQLTCADMSYTFPPGTQIPGGGYLVVAAAPADIESVYGITNVTGPYDGSLKHSETLELLDEQTNVLLTVPYTDVYPWPVATGGTGHSLVLANPTYGEGDPRAWDISDVIGGSPGEMDGFTPSPLRNVV
ncbi:MAG: lamin tail domain-containing protein, partial [Verrucomicrobiota bacterium]